MTEMTEAQTQALGNTLLPLKRRLSDQLDQAMKAPAVQDWMDGKSDCR